MYRYFLVITITFVANCGTPEQPNIPIPADIHLNCVAPSISFQSKNRMPNTDQVLNHVDGTRIVTGIISCNDRAIAILAHFNSSALEDEYLAVNYGTGWLPIWKRRGDSAGTGYLNVAGVDTRYIYYSVSYLSWSDFFLNSVSHAQLKFDWRTGQILQ